jgi:hypothetical protein
MLDTKTGADANGDTTNVKFQVEIATADGIGYGEAETSVGRRFLGSVKVIRLTARYRQASQNQKLALSSQGLRP